MSSPVDTSPKYSASPHRLLTIVYTNSLLIYCLSFVYSEPTVFENYVHDLYIDDQLIELALWDTAGTSVVLLSTRIMR